TAKNDHRPIRDDGIRADHMDLRTQRSVDFERNDAVKTALVEKTKRVAVTDRPVAQLDSNGVAIVQDINVEQGSRQERVQHHAANSGDQACIDHGAGAYRLEDFFQSGEPPLDVDIIVI